jgi:SAM-dependent methyltransferase
LVTSAIEDGFLSFTGKDVLHFAPEPSLSRLIDGQKPARRVTSSYPDQSGDLRLNIEAIDLPDRSFDTIICSHILEHVDDGKALAELHRVLRPGGELVIEVPIVEGWATTYENPGAQSKRERHIHFGQWNHVRFYGRDLRDRIRDAGFDLSEYTASPRHVVRYGLQRGETVFVGLKA